MEMTTKIPKSDEARQKLKIIFLGVATIKGMLNCDTGLHIGNGNDELKIGGIDKYVIKTANNQPYIPGSSFKGKTRSLFEKWKGLPSNRKGADKIYRYEAADINTALSCELSRLFGSTSNNENTDQEQNLNFPSRLIVRDLLPCKKPDGKYNYNLEQKSENTLDRLSAHANPRTNERVADGSKFQLHLDYTLEVITDDEGTIYLGTLKDSDAVENGIDGYITNTIEDLKNIFNTLMLLEHSYLGGNGSRGYGRVSFSNLSLEINTVSQLLSAEGATEPLTFKENTSKEIRVKIDRKKNAIGTHIRTYYNEVSLKK